MSCSLPCAAKILFLSDVHLGAFDDNKNRQLENQLIALVDFAERKNYRIAVLGDLFDYWIEYPGFVPSLGHQLLKRFREFHRSSPPGLYITGNHDNWTLGEFARCGFSVEPDCRLLTINNRRLLMLHGDATGPGPRQLERPLMHRLIRNSTFLKLYRSLLPPQAGLGLMKYFSALSRSLNDKINPEPLNRWAATILKNEQIDLLICGHDHIPRIRQFNYGTYINLGNFYRHKSLAVYNNRQFSLVEWDNSNKTLIPLSSQPALHE